MQAIRKFVVTVKTCFTWNTSGSPVGFWSVILYLVSKMKTVWKENEHRSEGWFWTELYGSHYGPILAHYAFAIGDPRCHETYQVEPPQTFLLSQQFSTPTVQLGNSLWNEMTADKRLVSATGAFLERWSERAPPPLLEASDLCHRERWSERAPTLRGKEKKKKGFSTFPKNGAYCRLGSLGKAERSRRWDPKKKRKISTRPRFPTVC